MNINIRQYNRENFKLMNFDHLMQIYETNYHLIQNVFDSLTDNKILSTIILNNHVIQYEPVSVSKYTIIFKFYYRYNLPIIRNGEYFIKPHIIYTLYKDAKLLEAKSLSQNREFDIDIGNKIRINLNIYFWLKSLVNKSIKYQ
tara:strand:- start:2681 stop:3109 length:429 start_codon:yes stop_codon:yes gene_type:complete